MTLNIFFAWWLLVMLVGDGIGRFNRAFKEETAPDKWARALGAVTMWTLAAWVWFHPTIWSTP